MKKIEFTTLSAVIMLFAFALVLGARSDGDKQKSKAFEITSDVICESAEKSQSTNFALRASLGARLVLVKAHPGANRLVPADSGAVSSDSGVSGEPNPAKNSQSRPVYFSLSQNYPNPFNPETRISYALPVDCHVKLTIYNLVGQKVRALIDQYQAAGYKTIPWNGKDDDGKETASGVYFYRLTAGDFSATRKMVILK
jgi:hypothetical protein